MPLMRGSQIGLTFLKFPQIIGFQCSKKGWFCGQKLKGNFILGVCFDGFFVALLG